MATATTMDAVRDIVSKHKTTPSEDELKLVEESILALGKQLAAQKNIPGLEQLMVETRPLYELMGRAKAAKLIRALVEQCLSVDQSETEKVNLVRKCIDWAAENKRAFLKRTLEARLIRLHNDNGNYVDAMKMAAPLTSELKKLEDRELLMEVTLEESRSAYNLKNYMKAKAALIMARTNANGSYVSTSMQASIDLQSGILYSTDEKDFRTAYSYCYEALEGFLLSNDKRNATRALKYMCLCKIMNNEADQVPQLLSTKVVASVTDRAIDGMKEMAMAFKERSLARFQKCLDDYKTELVEDMVVFAHSTQLHADMLEKEISRVIQPYSEVDLAHIEKIVGMPQQKIEKALATMLLDKKMFGCIDQSRSTVRVFPKPTKDKTFKTAVQLIAALNKSVDGTYLRAVNFMN